MKMLNRLSPVLLLAMVALFFQSCSKEEDPLPIEVQSKLLAGDKGQSKTWRLTLAEGKEGVGNYQQFNLGACFLDNTYTFSNDPIQSYLGREGPTKCDPSDPNIIERGSWLLTLDAKLVVISANEVYSDNGLFSLFPFPAKVITLTNSELVIEMDLVFDDGPFSYRFTFALN